MHRYRIMVARSHIQVVQLMLRLLIRALSFRPSNIDVQTEDIFSPHRGINVEACYQMDTIRLERSLSPSGHCLMLLSEMGVSNLSFVKGDESFIRCVTGKAVFTDPHANRAGSLSLERVQHCLLTLYRRWSGRVSYPRATYRDRTPERAQQRFRGPTSNVARQQVELALHGTIESASIL